MATVFVLSGEKLAHDPDYVRPEQPTVRHVALLAAAGFST
jgi:hypothetical protein